MQVYEHLFQLLNLPIYRKIIHGLNSSIIGDVVIDILSLSIWCENILKMMNESNKN